MVVEIGKNIKQSKGYKAFVPAPFPPKGIFDLSPKIIIKAAEASALIGKLDGITDTLPDVDFFLKMFVAKDAASSAQIEGTKATLVDAIEMNIGVPTEETDAGDILYYVKALNYGIERVKKFPISLRLIKEIHKELMLGARATHFSDPGEFRHSQNYIGGTSPANAHFVPPPVTEMIRALGDFEKFLHDKTKTMPLIYIALMHAQFEAMHPFLDGNGRAGRLLVTLLSLDRKLLERPVLFLSSYFKKHQKVYYTRLNDYHDGSVEEWLDFFFDGVIETAKESIEISKKIRALRDRDMLKIQALGKREAESGVVVLPRLFADPIITVKNIMDWTRFTRKGAMNVIERFVNLEILTPRDEEATYDKAYGYKDYLDIFTK
jgi:Fic family protein